ncbi:hypothetical protein ACE2AJ_00575 [Aquihabitans daechungensis]|uniref:hypothetical protein n=1 Tax=Aquihabitans daechungensis TaxID=1052257 RepID=UPI003B9EB305
MTARSGRAACAVTEGGRTLRIDLSVGDETLGWIRIDLPSLVNGLRNPGASDPDAVAPPDPVDEREDSLAAGEQFVPEPFTHVPALGWIDSDDAEVDWHLDVTAIGSELAALPWERYLGPALQLPIAARRPYLERAAGPPLGGHAVVVIHPGALGEDEKTEADFVRSYLSWLRLRLNREDFPAIVTGLTVVLTDDQVGGGAPSRPGSRRSCA